MTMGHDFSSEGAGHSAESDVGVSVEPIAGWPLTQYRRDMLQRLSEIPAGENTSRSTFAFRAAIRIPWLPPR